MAEIVTSCVLFVFLLVAAVQDIKNRKIKNWWNLAGILAAFFLALFREDITVLEFFIGVLVAFALSFFCWKLRAFKAGDAKMLCVIGGLFGWKLFLCDFLLTILLGGAVGLCFLVYRKIRFRKSEKEVQEKEKRSKIPFALVIAVAAAVSWIFQQQLIDYLFQGSVG